MKRECSEGAAEEPGGVCRVPRKLTYIFCMFFFCISFFQLEVLFITLRTDNAYLVVTVTQYLNARLLKYIKMRWRNFRMRSKGRMFRLIIVLFLPIFSKLHFSFYWMWQYFVFNDTIDTILKLDALFDGSIIYRFFKMHSNWNRFPLWCLFHNESHKNLQSCRHCPQT